MKLEAPPPAWCAAFTVLFVAATTASGTNDTNEDQTSNSSTATAWDGNVCRKSQFQCNTGVCLESSMLCDGTEDCEDGSDETQDACASNICGDHTFQCKYGACIDEEFACDGKRHCADWSDEYPRVCREFRASLMNSTRFRRTTKKYTKVQREGLQKKSDCSTFIQDSVPLEQGTLPRSVLPWHALLYMRRKESSYLTCGGTIISPHAIITAAHCIWESVTNEVQDLSLYSVVVGKFKLEETQATEQMFQVKEIQIPETFKGFSKHFESDVAILILKGEIQTNEFVHPICLDVENMYSMFMTPGKRGIVGGWNANITEWNAVLENGTLQLHFLPYVPALECEKNVPEKFLSYLTFDKFCAGLSMTNTLCNGDSGGGYATQFRNGKWYLTGVVSVQQYELGHTCNSTYYFTFTRISLYIDFIKKFVVTESAPTSPPPTAEESVTIRTTTTMRPSISSTLPSQPPAADIQPRPVSSQRPTGEACRNNFKCLSGHCIDKLYVCDGVNHCLDGSDEDPRLCGSTNSINLSRSCSSKLGCTWPEQPRNGRYEILGCNSILQAVPGNNTPAGVALNYTCNPGFILDGSQIVVCVDEWFSTVPPVCKEVMCPPLSDNSRDIVCILQGKDFDCKHPMPPGTRATVTCKIQYENVPGLRTYDMFCENDGTWNRQLHACVPKCGEPNPMGLTLIGNGQPSEQSEYPWHIGLYKYDSHGSLNLICGGSLISSRVIVTASHCFPDDTKENMQNTINQYKFVAGKYYRDWNITTKYTQHLEVERIVLHSQYRGGMRNYINDIAVIILKYEVRMDESVRPLCIDFEKSFLKYFTPGIMGNVNGWGLTENQKASEVLQTANLPYVSQIECEQNSPASFQNFLIADKFCAGIEKTTVCQGDSGGGYAVKFPHTTRYYLVGVVSIGPTQQCALYPYAAFTSVYAHLDFIKDFVYSYF